MDRLTRHAEDLAHSHVGYVLTAGENLVGVLLMIFRRVSVNGGSHLRCNLSSWCVDEAYRSYGSLLVTMATRDKAVTYINISPERHTRRIVEAQGFTRYADGLFLSVPLLSGRSGTPVAYVTGDTVAPANASADDVALVEAHANLGCLTLWCVAPDGAYPFVFSVSRRLKRTVRVAHVVYCPDPVLVARFSQGIGVFLARRRIFFISIDTNGSIAGLRGRYFKDRMPKYFRGDHKPRLGDLAYTELPLFGA
ncbi:hypothetical protein [Lichenifustis flavocetrariae]|uniref:Uncharacterized protein n=1 Tax=Lichenifustis flavocetrariae TaxID=2949735 RepID=A0AA41Z5B7_9HYPH|nr:hypothetical protein [Lichenifustis flavocetrariae]MCW6513243.1 hypothetical protein [Lichenifustis flavocetrariae]